MNDFELKAAQELEERLSSQLPAGFAQINISTYGSLARVLVSCRSGPRACTTHSPSYGVPLPEGTEREFLTYFEESGKPQAAGTSSSLEETANAIDKWLHDAHLEMLYEQFPFIDRRKRDLAEIRQAVLHAIPGLETSIGVDLREFNFRYGLWFTNETRSVMVNGDCKEALFRWDQSVLFRFRVENAIGFAAVLKSWLCDDAPPSAMRQLFPWIEIGELADYFERGDPITGEFLQSWNETQKFVGSSYFPGGTLMLPLLSELRKKGFDRKLRVGLAHGRPIIFSRSRYADLRDDQPYVMLYVDPERGTVSGWTKFALSEKIPESPASLSTDLEQLFDRLAESPIS